MSKEAHVSFAAGETLTDVAWTVWQTPPDPLDIPTEPVDTRLWSGYLTVRPSQGAGTTFLELTTDNGGLTIVDGVIKVVLSQPTSAALTPGTYYYELHVTYSDGESRVRLFYGNWLIRPNTV